MYFSFSIFKRTLSFKIVNDKVFNISFLIVKKPDKETHGITSRCYGGTHVLFFDYDGLAFEEMIEELDFLIQEFQLSSFYLFKNDRENSFHAICLDKFPLYEAIDIISRSSADKGFKKAPILFRQKRWVLRVLPKGKRKKPEFIGIIKSHYSEYQTSTAHKIFLEEHYGIKLKNVPNEDGFNNFVEICEFNTGSNV